MVTLEFKQLIMRNGIRFDYKGQLAEIVRSVPPLDPEGRPKSTFSEADMAAAEALADKIEAANGSVELTSAEVMHLADKVANAQWLRSDRVFLEFAADIRELRNQ